MCRIGFVGIFNTVLFFFNLLNFVSLVSVNVLKTICPDFTTIDSFTCHVVMSIDIYQNLYLLCILIEF